MMNQDPAVTLSVRVRPHVRDQLDELSEATGRTKSFLAAEAIENYLATQAWQVKAIKKALKQADSKTVKFVEHDDVVAWVNQWANEDEKDING